MSTQFEGLNDQEKRNSATARIESLERIAQLDPAERAGELATWHQQLAELRALLPAAEYHKLWVDVVQVFMAREPAVV